MFEEIIGWLGIIGLIFVGACVYAVVSSWDCWNAICGVIIVLWILGSMFVGICEWMVEK